MIANPNFRRSWKFDSNGVLRAGAEYPNVWLPSRQSWQIHCGTISGGYRTVPGLSRPDAIGRCLSVVSRPGCELPLDLRETAQSAVFVRRTTPAGEPCSSSDFCEQACRFPARSRGRPTYSKIRPASSPPLLLGPARRKRPLPPHRCSCRHARPGPRRGGTFSNLGILCQFQRNRCPAPGIPDRVPVLLCLRQGSVT